MNKNEQFELTEFWSKKLKGNLKSYYKTVHWGPLTALLLNVVFCLVFERRTGLNFWILLIPLTIGTTIFAILAPQKAIKRYSNAVQAFEFKRDDEISLTLIDGRILIISNPEFKDDVFTVDKSEKVCKTVIDKANENNYTIIPEFFTNPPIL